MTTAIEMSEAGAAYMTPMGIANRGLDLASALYPVEPNRAAEIVKETIEWYTDTVLEAEGKPYAAIVNLARKREDDSLVAGYKSVTDLGDGCWSRLWLPEDQEDAWYWHMTCARKIVKGIAKT